MGKNRKSALLTMVERITLCTVITRLMGKHSKPLATTTIDKLNSLKTHIKTITLDNGLEFSEHEKIASVLEADIDFTPPYPS